jgi:hypothetical protein
MINQRVSFETMGPNPKVLTGTALLRIPKGASAREIIDNDTTDTAHAFLRWHKKHRRIKFTDVNTSHERVIVAVNRTNKDGTKSLTVDYYAPLRKRVRI